MHVNLCWPKPSHSCEETKCTSKWVDQTHPMPAMTENVSQPMLTKSLPCLRGPKMLFNICWPNPSHHSENTKYISTWVWPNFSHTIDDRKCISTCVDQTHPMPARTKNVSQHVFKKFLPCQRGHKMHLNMCWQNTSHDSEDSKCISTCADQDLPCLRGHKMYHNMY